MRIEVKNLTHIYQKGLPYETTALDDVSFVIPEGEFASVIGHTGSGKTTLVMHIAGLLKATSGEVAADRKKIGIVFQYPEYQLFEESVLKDVCFGPKNLGFTEDEQIKKAKEALLLVGLDPEKYSELSPFGLSGGQKRRVAIAGVLAMDPEVLILDEPTAGLDPKGHADILEMIDNIRKKKTMSIILISHNMDDVAKFAEHILVMDKGKLIMDGTPHEVFSRADELKSVGLGLTSGGEFLRRLRENGADISGYALSFEETRDVILKHYGN